LTNAIIDTKLYDKSWNLQNFVFTPYLFFKVNVMNSVSLFYGVHTWHWYLSQCIPVIFTTFLPLLAYGFYRVYTHQDIYNRIKPLLLLSIWVIVIYSLLPHKEFRFIFPVVPILLMIVAYGLQQIGSLRWRKRMILFLVVTQFPLALYLSLWHQRGVMDVMHWLRSNTAVKSVGVIMPCHSTPWYSIMHKEIPMWFLTCEPPLEEKTDELDEADQFYQDPVSFLKTHQHDRLWPTSHLVLFDNLLPQVQEVLTDQGYKECKRFFNSHFHDDSRRRGDVVVLCHHQG
jgi:phosphatidylinositol glycan class B